MPRYFHRSCWVLLLICLAAGCRSSGQERPSNYLVLGIEANPAQLDPRYATDANAVRIGNLIYNSLLRADEKMQLQAELAESWRRLDERTFQFDLRQNVKFHDGRPLTAADVKFTFESILDPANRSPKRALLKQLQAIELAGSHRLRFHLNAPHAPFVEHFTLGIVPQGSPADQSTAARLRTVHPREIRVRRKSYLESELVLLGKQTGAGRLGIQNRPRRHGASLGV